MLRSSNRDFDHLVIVAPAFMHYRLSVLEALVRNEEVPVRLIAGSKGYANIFSLAPDQLGSNECHQHRSILGFIWLRGITWRTLVDQRSCVVLSPSLRFINAWLITAGRRVLGLPTLFWGGCWKSHQRSARQIVKKLMLRLSDGLLVYDKRAADIASELGVFSRPAVVVGNSLNYLDTPSRELIRSRRRQFRSTDQSVFTLGYLGRVRTSKRLDLLVDALAILNQSRSSGSPHFRAVIVGDGDDHDRLATLASSAEAEVEFGTGIFSLPDIAGYYSNVDLTVCPGDCGLLAVQSIAFGVPIVTHDRHERHGPEVSAITPGVTGSFYRFEDAQALADAILDWVKRLAPPDRLADSLANEVATTWSPESNAQRVIQGARQLVSEHRSASSGA